MRTDQDRVAGVLIGLAAGDENGLPFMAQFECLESLHFPSDAVDRNGYDNDRHDPINCLLRPQVGIQAESPKAGE
jgi:hypothetical protein